MLSVAINEQAVSVVRYPRGAQIDGSFDYSANAYSVIGQGKKAVVTYGRTFLEAAKAVEHLDDTALIKLNCIHPLPDDLKEELKKYDAVYFFEEGIRNGGIGEQMGDMILSNRLGCKYTLTAVDDTYVAAASVKSQIKKFRLDSDSIIKTLKGE